MAKQWFLIKSLGITVDLDLISEVIWNSGSAARAYYYATGICLGTSIAYDSMGGEFRGNYWYVQDREDRESLQKTLVSLGLPTIKLLFQKDSNCQ